MSRQHRKHREAKRFWFNKFRETKYKWIHYKLYKQNKNGKWVTFTSKLEK